MSDLRRVEVSPNFKPDPIPCPCSCGKEGQPRRKAWRDGLVHVRSCVCRRCKAPNYRKAAAKRERAIAKDTGGTRSALSGALNGADVTGPLVDCEETSSEAVVRGIRRWWESKTVATKVARLMGRYTSTPKALVLTWDRRRRVVVMTYEDFAALAKLRLKEPEDAA